MKTKTKAENPEAAKDVGVPPEAKPKRAPRAKRVAAPKKAKAPRPAKEKRAKASKKADRKAYDKARRSSAGSTRRKEQKKPRTLAKRKTAGRRTQQPMVKIIKSADAQALDSLVEVVRRGFLQAESSYRALAEKAPAMVAHGANSIIERMGLTPATAGYLALKVAEMEKAQADARLKREQGPRHVYIAHALGKGEDRDENINRAAHYAAWAAEQGVIPVCSWIVLAQVWPEDEKHRTLGLAVDEAQLARCDELWLVGPKVSAGMKAEAKAAERLGLYVHDRTGEALLPEESSVTEAA